jgi:2'-5' RNA ligase
LGETAIVVMVPEAGPAVGALYRTHTSAGREGMSPHVTLLIPFADSGALPLADVRTLVGSFAPFAFELTEIRRFEPSTGTILWLAPKPATRFVELTQALVDAFPAQRPYDGAFEDIVPHLTVAVSGDPDVVERIDEDIGRALPIAARADAATIVERRDGRWQPHTTIPFGLS